MKKYSFYLMLLAVLPTNLAAQFTGGFGKGETLASILNITLPITLSSFTATCNGANIVLNWSTASTSNNDFFTVERSEGAFNWQNIVEIKSIGNSNQSINYHFTDNRFNAATVYYRLKQTDLDGGFTYSETILVKDCKNEFNEINLTIYPNPAVGVFNLLVKGNKDQIRSIDIYNMLGDRVYNLKSYQSIIDLSDKPDGMYVIYLNLDTKVITKTILIKR